MYPGLEHAATALILGRVTALASPDYVPGKLFPNKNFLISSLPDWCSLPSNDPQQPHPSVTMRHAGITSVKASLSPLLRALVEDSEVYARAVVQSAVCFSVIPRGPREASQGSFDKPSEVRMYETYYKMCDGRRLAVINGEWMAVVPQETNEGDWVALLRI